MRINAKTKISELVRYNKDSIEAIASLSKPLRKLKNPVLRKVMASRVTLAEAAKIGKSSMEEFAVVLKPLGFIFEEKKTEAQQTKEIPPTWLDKLSNQVGGISFVCCASVFFSSKINPKGFKTTANSSIELFPILAASARVTLDAMTFLKTGFFSLRRGLDKEAIASILSLLYLTSSDIFVFALILIPFNKFIPKENTR